MQGQLKQYYKKLKLFLSKPLLWMVLCKQTEKINFYLILKIQIADLVIFVSLCAEKEKNSVALLSAILDFEFGWN